MNRILLLWIHKIKKKQKQQPTTTTAITKAYKQKEKQRKICGRYEIKVATDCCVKHLKQKRTCRERKKRKTNKFMLNQRFKENQLKE